MYKVLIIEDDQKIRTLIHNYLQKWGFEPHVVETFNEIDKHILTIEPHLVLLDINLPSYDGFYWCTKIRQISNVPIIFISSRTQHMDIVMAMNMGGDDYIAKPFSLEVLVAKMNAVIRRTNANRNHNSKILEHNGILLNIEKSAVHYQKKTIDMTRNEFLILYLLMKKAGNIVPRDEIMRALWENEQFIDDNTLTVNVTRLRKKLESIGLQDAIVTKKRQGYLLK